MTRLIALMLLPAVLLLLGCTSGPGAVTSAPAPVAQVDAINLQALPAALNFDQDLRPDGVQARAFFFQLQRAESVPVRGTLELLLFEGAIGRGEVSQRQPLRVWRYGQRELAASLFEGMPGWGYTLTLLWGADVPTTPAVSLVARYHPPPQRGRMTAPLDSDPVVIAVNNR